MVESSLGTKPIALFDLLVVDDQHGQLQSLQQLLHISGDTHVELASGGDEAIKKLQNNSPQLLHLDLQMHGTNGLNILEFHQQASCSIMPTSPCIMLSTPKRQLLPLLRCHFSCPKNTKTPLGDSCWIFRKCPDRGKENQD